MVNRSEVEVIINRFPINLRLELGANFTERTTYTGIYNTSDQGFDLSFRVQCSENYYGSMCAEFCEPILGVYEGRAVCVLNSTTDCKIPSQTIVIHQGQSAIPWDGHNVDQEIFGRKIFVMCVKTFWLLTISTDIFKTSVTFDSMTTPITHFLIYGNVGML